jgi:hypothetical protein
MPFWGHPCQTALSGRLWPQWWFGEAQNSDPIGSLALTLEYYSSFFLVIGLREKIREDSIEKGFRSATRIRTRIHYQPSFHPLWSRTANDTARKSEIVDHDPKPTGSWFEVRGPPHHPSTGPPSFGEIRSHVSVASLSPASIAGGSSDVFRHRPGSVCRVPERGHSFR